MRLIYTSILPTLLFLGLSQPTVVLSFQDLTWGQVLSISIIIAVIVSVIDWGFEEPVKAQTRINKAVKCFLEET